MKIFKKEFLLTETWYSKTRYKVNCKSSNSIYYKKNFGFHKDNGPAVYKWAVRKKFWWYNDRIMKTEEIYWNH